MHVDLTLASLIDLVLAAPSSDIAAVVVVGHVMKILKSTQEDFGRVNDPQKSQNPPCFDLKMVEKQKTGKTA